MSQRAAIASLGAGRMGRGIAVAFGYAGHAVTLVDFKPRDAAPHAAGTEGRDSGALAHRKPSRSRDCKPARLR